MRDLFTISQEISSHDGILLKKGPALFLNEILNCTTGTLSLVHYVSSKLYIEWRPIDHYLISDADTQEQDDWSFVDTITKRNRTASECLAFNNPTIDERPNATLSSASKAKILRTNIGDLKTIEVLKSGHLIRLISNVDGKANSEYFFQNGNADGFVRTLQTTHCLRRSRHYRNHYEILSNVECDTEKLQKTFAELKIEDIKGAHSGGWISSMMRNPLEHTMDFLAKMSDVYPVYPNSDQSPKQSPISPTTPTMTTTAPTTTTVSKQTTTTNNDEYEVLGTSPRSNGDDDDENDRIQNGNNENGSRRYRNGDRDDDSKYPKLPPRPSVSRGPSLSLKQWQEFQSEDGRISDSNRVKEIIFRGGIENNLRKEVWKFLLNYYDWNATNEQRIAHRSKKEKEYYQMKMQWLSMSEIQEKNFSDYRDRKCQIEKDVKRTDRTLEYFAGDENPNLSRLQDILMTYVMYNFDLGYVQGMSDLLAPILSTMENEVSRIMILIIMDDVPSLFPSLSFLRVRPHLQIKN